MTREFHSEGIRAKILPHIERQQRLGLPNSHTVTSFYILKHLGWRFQIPGRHGVLDV